MNDQPTTDDELLRKPHTFEGFKIFASCVMIEDGDPVEVTRERWERWFTRPWRPWQKTKIIIPKVPMREIYFDKLTRSFYAHPQTIDAIRKGALEPKVKEFACAEGPETGGGKA